MGTHSSGITTIRMKTMTMLTVLTVVALVCGTSTGTATLYVGYTNETEVWVGSIDTTTGEVTPMCAVDAPTATWISPGAYSTELSYVTQSGDLGLVDIDQGSCTFTSTPFTSNSGSTSGVVLASEPANGGGDGTYVQISFPNVTFGSLALSSGELDSSYPSTLVSSFSSVEASLFDTANNVWVVATSSTIFKASYVTREYLLPPQTSVQAMAFNCRNNGYVAIVSDSSAGSAPYVASVSLNSPVSFSKIVALPTEFVGGCLESATYDIPAGKMYALCGDATGALSLAAIPLDGSPVSSVSLSLPSSTSYQFLVSA